VQDHCNNVLETVDRGVESRVDLEQFSITRNGKTTLVQPHPISIDPDYVAASLPADLASAERRLRNRLHLRNEQLLVGVDRVDYTKGIPERFRAVGRLLELHPDLAGSFTFVQVGAPSRVHIPAYRRLNEELSELADDINWRYGSDEWRPIVFLNEHYGPDQVYLLDRISAGCVVSSLHDGMNLVAKEFVASRTDGRGVLVLSRFAGAARELGDAVLINPYAIDEFAEALRLALTMPVEEQERRMARMRQEIEDNNVYRWAGMLLSEASKLVQARPLVESRTALEVPA
jgi:trehalose 6-phosphate synthase